MTDKPKKFMVKSSERRIAILNAVAEKNHLDKHSIINNLIMEWVLLDIDDEELIEPIRKVFSSSPA